MDDEHWRQLAERQRMSFFLCIVPPGGGDQDFGVDVVDVQRVPAVGEYVRLQRHGEVGMEFFRVLLVDTDYRQAHPEDDTPFTETRIWVLAEYIEGPDNYMTSSAHRKAVNAFKKQGRPVQREPGWGY